MHYRLRKRHEKGGKNEKSCQLERSFYRAFFGQKGAILIILGGMEIIEKHANLGKCDVFDESGIRRPWGVENDGLGVGNAENDGLGVENTEKCPIKKKFAKWAFLGVFGNMTPHSQGDNDAPPN